MKSYYSEKLSAEHLKRCYEIAPPRVRRYLEMELDFVLQRIRPADLVLELGCGYGRILPRLAVCSGSVTGIDISFSSLLMAQELLQPASNIMFAQMNALCLSFPEGIFDIVICIQNGISAFKVNPSDLIRESCRVAKPGGLVMISTYSEKFWDHRLKWFKLQSEAGLLGEIDWQKTQDGVIVCKDGFRAVTLNVSDFEELTQNLDAEVTITEVDESSLLCEIIMKQ